MRNASVNERRSRSTIIYRDRLSAIRKIGRYKIKGLASYAVRRGKSS